MSSRSRVVTSTACPVNVSRPVVTVSCPTTFPTTLPATTTTVPTTTLPTTTTVPTTTAGVTDALANLAQSLGMAATPFGLGTLGQSAPQQVFNNPAVDLGAFNPVASLAAFNPSAALAAKSPVLGIFNPAINPAAAFLQFNPAAAPTLALQGKGFGKPFFGI